MESAGARLKKIRLQKGLSLEEVNKNTKIHLNILKAIEEDSLNNLRPVYIKGFMKIYCQFLGVSPKDYLQDYRETQPMPGAVSDAKEKAVFIKPSSLKEWDFMIRITRVLVVVLIFIFLSFSLFKLGKFVSSGRSSSAKKDKVSVPASAKAVSAKTKPPPVSTTEIAPKRETIAGIRLVIQAKENCWVRLTADGRVIFQNILRKGRSETWQAKDKIELSLGNAGVVVLEVNGKVMPSLGRKGQTIKNIVITAKEGLKVLR
jgi:cytoskeletal protein RodZ